MIWKKDGLNVRIEFERLIFFLHRYSFSFHFLVSGDEPNFSGCLI